MESITVNFNGRLHVRSVTEVPAEGQTAGEYAAALADAHGIDGTGHEFVMPDGEPVPDDLDVELLAGLTVNLRAEPTADEDDAPAAKTAPAAPRAPKAADVKKTPAKRARKPRKAAAKKTPKHK